MEGRWIFKRHLQNFCASLSAGPSIEHGPPDRPPPQPRRRRSCSSNAEFSLSPCLSGVRLSTGCHGRDASSVHFAIHRVPWPRVGGDTPAWSPSASRALTASPKPKHTPAASRTRWLTPGRLLLAEALPVPSSTCPGTGAQQALPRWPLPVPQHWQYGT